MAVLHKEDMPDMKDAFNIERNKTNNDFKPQGTLRLTWICLNDF